MGNIKYVLMAISICLSVFSSCLLRSFSSKKLASNSGDLFLFNAALSTEAQARRLLFAVVEFLFNKVAGKPNPKIRKGAWVYVIVCGIASCLYQRLNVMLAKEILSVIFFPVSNGSIVLLSTVMGKVLFRENLKPMQIFGIIIGLTAIIMTGCSSLIYSLSGR